MDDPLVIFEIPFKPNIEYSVNYIPNDKSIEDCCKWLIVSCWTRKVASLVQLYTARQSNNVGQYPYH